MSPELDLPAPAGANAPAMQLSIAPEPRSPVAGRGFRNRRRGIEVIPMPPSSTKPEGDKRQVLSEVTRLGAVTIRPFKPGRVTLDFVIADGSRQRSVVPATDRLAAELMATQVATAIQAQRLGISAECPLSIVARLQGKQRAVPAPALGPTIPEAMESAIETRSQASPVVKGQYRVDAKRFQDWLAGSRPNLPNRWSSITLEVAQSYANSLDRQLSAARIRHIMVPVVLAIRYHAANEPDLYRDVAALIRLPEGRPKAPTVALGAKELLTLIARISVDSPALQPIVALTSMAGLRVTEAAHLRLCDVDLVAGTVTVTDTKTHVPKTRSSWRTIPLCQQALAALRASLKKSQPVDPSAPLFLTTSGLPWTKDRLEQSWQRFISATQESASLPKGYTLRGGRRSFASIVHGAGGDRDLLQAYMGHAPTDILGKNYLDLSKLKRVANAMDEALSGVAVSTVDMANGQAKQDQSFA